jgi:hypothetical protein
MVDSKDTDLGASGGVSLSEGVSMESELNRDVRFGGPRRVNLPRLGYLVVLCPNDDETCLPSERRHVTYEEASLTPGVFSVRLKPEFMSRAPSTVLLACASMVTGVLHRSIFSFPDIDDVFREGLMMMGLGVRCFRRDLTYSDSNWNSSEGGSSSCMDNNAEDIACNAVIAS